MKNILTSTVIALLLISCGSLEESKFDNLSDFSLQRSDVTIAQNGRLKWVIRDTGLVQIGGFSGSEILFWNEKGIWPPVGRDDCLIVDNQLIDGPSPFGEVLLELESKTSIVTGYGYPALSFSGKNIKNRQGKTILTSSHNLKNYPKHTKFVVASLSLGICGAEGL